jgi:RimJ/RimL family protein N-acetyltransferase
VDIRPPDPPLADGVVALRPWRSDDVAALVSALDGDEEIAFWLDMIPQPYTDADARAWIAQAAALWRNQTSATFAVTGADDNEVLGGIGLRVVDRDDAVAEVGYWTRSEARGRGVTTRAVRLVSHWAFELGCERLQLKADVRNPASCRVADRAGFRREGVQRAARYSPRQNRRVDFVVYSLLPTD